MPREKKHTESLYQNIREIKTFYDRELNKYKNERHPGHDQIRRLNKYGAQINKCIKSGGLNYNNIDDLIKYNKAVDTENIYTNKVGKHVLDWQNDEPSRKSMEKFTQMIMQNDLRKLEYFRVMAKKNPSAQMQMKDVMALPVPLVREGTLEDAKNLRRNINQLAKRLEATGSSFHNDSAEAKKMKEAVKKLNETLHSKGVSRELIGKQLEDLNKASMDYVKAKGVGKQYSKGGQERMDIALDICSLSSDFMNVFASKERIKQIEANEKKFLSMNRNMKRHSAKRTSLSKNGVLDFMNDNLEKYNPETKKQIIKETKAKIKEEKVLENDFSL